MKREKTIHEQQTQIIEKVIDLHLEKLDNTLHDIQDQVLSECTRNDLSEQETNEWISDINLKVQEKLFGKIERIENTSLPEIVQKEIAKLVDKRISEFEKPMKEISDEVHDKLYTENHPEVTEIEWEDFIHRVSKEVMNQVYKWLP